MNFSIIIFNLYFFEGLLNQLKIEFLTRRSMLFRIYRDHENQEALLRSRRLRKVISLFAVSTKSRIQL